MSCFLINLFPILFFLLLAIGLHPVSLRSGFNENYLSVETTKSYRGVFALVVVFHHISQKIGTDNLFTIFSNAGYLAVSVFFFLSGYGLQRSFITKKEQYKQNFLIRRLPSVLIPYLIAIMVYWFFDFFMGIKHNVNYVLSSFINGDPIVDNSWYIITIVIFYVFFWLFMCLCKNKMHLSFIYASIWYCAYALFCFKMRYGAWWYISTQCLVIGMLWASFLQKINEYIKKYPLIIGITWCCFIIFSIFEQKISNILPVPGLSLIFSIIKSSLFTVGFIMLATKCNFKSVALSMIGNISFEVYLFHGLILRLLRSNMICIQDNFLWCITSIALTILISGVMHRLLNIKCTNTCVKNNKLA